MIEQLNFIKEYCIYKEKHILNGYKDPLIMSDKEIASFLIDFIKEYFSHIYFSLNRNSSTTTNDDEDKINNKLNAILRKYNQRETSDNNLNEYKRRKQNYELSETFSSIDRTLKSLSENYVKKTWDFEEKNKEIVKLNDEIKKLSLHSTCAKCLNQSPLKSSFRQHSYSIKKKNTNDSSSLILKDPKTNKLKIDRLKSIQIAKDEACSYILNLKSFNQFKPSLGKKMKKEQKLEFTEVEDKNKLRYIISFNELAWDPFIKSSNSQVFYSSKNDLVNEGNKKLIHESPFLLHNEINELKSYLEEVSYLSNKASQRRKSLRKDSLVFNRKRSIASLLENTKDSFFADNGLNPNNKKVKAKKRDTIIYAEFDNEECSHVNCQIFDNDISALFKIKDNSFIKIKGSDCKILASMIYDYLEYDKVNAKLEKAKKYVKDVKDVLSIV